MSTKSITFTNKDGRQLSGRLDSPDGRQPLGYALLAHCFTCSKDLGSLRRLAGTITEFGIAVLSFDFTGLGHTGGEFEDTGFSVPRAKDATYAGRMIGAWALNFMGEKE